MASSPTTAPVSAGRRQHLARWIEAALDLIFPRVCAGCGQIGEPFCPRCAQAVTPVPLPQCAHCGRPQPAPTTACPECRSVQPDPLTMLRAAALHTHPLRAGIHALKYENHPELAPYLARYLTAVYQQPPWTKLPSAVDAVVPVPLHPQRRADRGYNQSELLAHAFGAQVGLPVAPAWLQRIRETRQQVGLGPAARHANVVDAFWADPAVAGRVLLLVDDVCTTGATLRACAAAAHAAGAAQVYALTLAIPVAAAAPAAPGLPWWEGQV